MRGAPFNSKFVKTVVTKPYNISVLQVSQPIIPPGIDTQAPWPSPGAQTPLPPRKVGPADSPVESPDSAADSPASDDYVPDDVEAPSPATGKGKKKKAGDSPSSAPAPGPDGAADAAADEDGDSSSSTSDSASTRVVGTSLMAFAAASSVLVALAL